MVAQLVILILSLLSALFATAVMSYIAMAVPIGPWVEATLVLLLSIVVKFLMHSVSKKQKSISLATAAGGIAGIAATGCAFSFPTLYFLDKDYFNSLVADPIRFSITLGGLVFISGATGLLVAQFLRKELIEDAGLSFPIGAMVHKIIVAQNQAKKSFMLLFGGISSVVFLALQQTIVGAFRVLPKTLTLIKKNMFTFNIASYVVPFSSPSLVLQLSILPLLFSIGFIAGHMIAIPLIVGAVSKVVVLEPLSKVFFMHISWHDFVLAFCSGMILQGALVSFLSLPKAFGAKRVTGSNTFDFLKKYLDNSALLYFVVFCLFLYFVFMWYLGLPFLAQVFLLFGAIVSAYQLCFIGGKIGLAPLGRYATFVMVPGVVLFGANPLFATVFATFVEVAGGVAVDSLFGYKTGELLKIEKKEVVGAQWLGLLVASLSIGFIFYFLISKFGLGSEELFAQKAQTRALLLNVNTFDIPVLFVGAAFGWILKKIKLNPMFVLTGILMPLDYSIGLIAGGLFAKNLKTSDSLTPFFSGAFCANSLWIVFSALLGR